MSHIDQLKSKLGKAQAATPKIVLDLTLADAGELTPDTTYLGRVVSARVVAWEDRTPKIDLCVEVLNNDGKRIGVINEDLYLSIRALRRFREFLLAADLPEDANNTALDPAELCGRLPGKHFGLVTQEGVHLDGTPRIMIAQFIPIDAIEATEVA
jgi:hypothetical protein